MGENSQHIGFIGEYISFTIIPKLLKELAQKVEIFMRMNLRQKTNISTDTLQNYVTSKVDSNEAIIYIDYEKMSEIESTPPQFSGMSYARRVSGTGLSEWGRFTNTFRSGKNYVGDVAWKGELISFRLAQWLDNGGSGSVGNQPIVANHWFQETERNIRQNLDLWVMQIMKKYGFVVQRK